MIKYVYISGLEHSGTTLLCHLLASQSDVLALGEVAQFFSDSHMRQYLNRWALYNDAKRCSCGQPWESCQFWSKLVEHNGKYTLDTLHEGYELLLNSVRADQRNAVVVDSSKSALYLKKAIRAWDRLGLPKENFLLLIVSRDPRGFARSIARKVDSRATLLANYRAMNWWRGSYAALLEYRANRVWSVQVVTYEMLCRQPELELRRIGDALGMDFSLEVDVNHAKSHIALGNKDFIERNRERLSCDESWKQDWRAKLAYAANWRVRKLHERILKLDG